MKVMQFEGTPEEFRAVAYLFDSSSTQPQEAPIAKDSTPTVDPVDAVRAMLTRIPISNGQKAVYKALAGGRLAQAELFEQTGRPSQVMAGVLGALGRRINNTPEIHQAGLPGDTSAMFNWEKEAGVWYISLQPYALEALEEEGVI